ncbi:hypothetical protein OC709_02030 ['Planchonia careya' phytoplasma]|nr:hypothetical protein ['Planchonia careya' phytoplasma]MDO8030278.1 hypothetical protein ['Planchonia careya' phytoplasma]
MKKIQFNQIYKKLSKTNHGDYHKKNLPKWQSIFLLTAMVKSKPSPKTGKLNGKLNMFFDIAKKYRKESSNEILNLYYFLFALYSFNNL